MRLALSLLSLRPGKVGGAETYIRSLVRFMPRVAERDELVAVMDREVADQLPTPGFRRVVVPGGSGRMIVERVLEAYTPWRAGSIRRVLDDLQPDATLFPQQSIFPEQAPGPAVLTVVDVQHLHHPENFGIFDRTFRPRVYPRSMARAARIIAISEYTRRTVIDRCGIAPGKVTALPFGIEPAPEGGAVALAPSALVRGPYLYYPAATYPHKGHEVLLRAFASLRSRGLIDDRLVLTGERTRHWKRRLEPLARQLGISHEVVHLGFVPYEEVHRLIAGASAVVFPTRFEGFGLPVLEAAQFGARLVTSRLEVFDEIGVPRDVQVDFADPGALLEALGRPRPTQLGKLPWTWEDHARRTLEILREVASGR
jgi:glycosyltransferase involved in cell wall biosynthesis